MCYGSEDSDLHHLFQKMVKKSGFHLPWSYQAMLCKNTEAREVPGYSQAEFAEVKEMSSGCKAE